MKGKRRRLKSRLVWKQKEKWLKKRQRDSESLLRRRKRKEWRSRMLRRLLMH